MHNAFHNDWLNLNDPTSEALFSTAFLVGMNRLTAHMASLTGMQDLAAKRNAIADSVKQNYIRKFFSADGELCEHSQTAAVLTFHFDLCPNEESKRKVLAALVKSIRDTHDTHLTTGGVGGDFVLGALAENGQIDLFYDVLCQTTYHSWIYPITKGATAMWERWDTWTDEKGFADEMMNSFNHEYGAMTECCYEIICGIKPDSYEQLSGFKHFRLEPQFGHRLDSASASYRSMYGTISSAWKRISSSQVEWRFSVPCNTTAKVTTPDGRSWSAEPGNYTVIVDA